MKFDVVIKKKDGEEEKRTVVAADRFAAYRLFEKEEATVLTLEENESFDFKDLFSFLSFTKSVSSSDKIVFVKNLASMLSAGLTLSRALSVIERQSSNEFLRKTVALLEEQVRKGTAFHEALAQYPHIFSKLLISMVRAGEESGTLAQSLSVIALQMERSDVITRKIRGAMIYPAIIFGAVIIIAILMLLYVVPTLSATFASLNVELPLMTQMIVGLSDFLVNNIVLVVLFLMLILIGGGAFVRSPRGAKSILHGALGLPVIGTLVQETMNARAARTLSSLLSSGVEMLNALQITQEVVGENHFGEIVGAAQTRVQKGESLSVVFAEYPKLYPIFFSDMIAVGEETGNVSHMLEEVAVFYEANVEEGTKDLSTIVEPMLMLLIGIFVGVFALAMIAPIYSLSNSI